MRFPSIKLRFSLRFLLLLTIVASIASYLLALPTVRVNRFVKAVESGDLAAVDRMFESGFGYGTKYQLQNAKIEIEPLTWTQIVFGERYITIDLPHGQEMKDSSFLVFIEASWWNLQIMFSFG